MTPTTVRPGGHDITVMVTVMVATLATAVCGNGSQGYRRPVTGRRGVAALSQSALNVLQRWCGS
jgi:hypothetical protein